MVEVVVLVEGPSQTPLETEDVAEVVDHPRDCLEGLLLSILRQLVDSSLAISQLATKSSVLESVHHEHCGDV